MEDEDTPEDSCPNDTIRSLEREVKSVREEVAYWKLRSEREREERQMEVGKQEYRGNTVSYIYDKAKIYGDMVHGCSPALAAAGFPVDENDPEGRASGIAKAVARLALALKEANAPEHRYGEWKEFTRLEKDLDNVSVFCRRMARALGSDHPISKAAIEYLQENDLIGSPLRE